MFSKTKKKIKTTLVIIIISIPLLGWTFVKQTRLLFPELNGVYCMERVCVETKSLYTEAFTLYQSSQNGISKFGVSVRNKPTYVYCVSNECYRSFGGGNQRAISYPFLGTIIAPNSWQQHISQHELIHWLQFQELGAIRTMFKPRWFREGMAYYYSQAPPEDIPNHYKPMITKFNKWQKDKSWEGIWLSSESL